MKKSICLLLSLALLACSILAQNQMNNWYFGNSGGITFNSTPPTALTNGSINQSEGCATISDKNGALLFYTSGTKIYDASHTTMVNGLGLLGNTNSAQSGIIVPMPLSDSLFYVFTVKNWTTSGYGFNYSIVNMRLAGNGNNTTPLGEVIQGKKNIPIHNDVREQVSAVYHSNCKDIWIITHQGSKWFSSDTFMVYLLTDTGLQMNPVNSVVGMTYSGSNRFGSLKPSHDGKKICSTLGGTSSTTVELYDFDNSTGTISNPIMISNDLSNAYSSEFSPDNNILYVTEHNGPSINQYDLSSGVQSTIIASKTDIASGGAHKPSLQIGPDKKIYVSRKGAGDLGIITNPDILGTSCNYIDIGVSLNGGTAQLGLPTFMQSFFLPQTFNKDTAICFGDTLHLDATAPNATYLWQDSSTNAVFSADQAGNYLVEISIYACKFIDSTSLSINPLPITYAGKDSIICPGDSLQIGTPPVTGSSYSWQSNNNLSNTTISNPLAFPKFNDTFIITEIDSNGCLGHDTLTINVHLTPDLALDDTITMCNGDSVKIITSGGINFLWSPSNIIEDIIAGSPLIFPNDSTELFVSFQDSASSCSGNDSVYVIVNDIDSIYLSGTDTLCLGDTATLNATGPDSCWWNTGNIGNTIYAVPVGNTEYIVWSNNSCGSDSDTIVINVIIPPIAEAGDDQSIMHGESSLLNGQGGISYSWSPSYSLECPDCQNTVASPSETTLYWLTITDGFGCVGLDSVLISVEYENNVFVPNAFSPDNNRHNDILYARTFGTITDIHFQIFNRWGELVFETYNMNDGWDGTYKNEEQPLDVYIYKLIANTLNGQVIEQNGDVTLLR